MNVHINANIARDRLQQVVESGVARATPVIEQVLNNAPTDRVVRGRALSFNVLESGDLELESPLPEPMRAHRHAFGQIVERAGIPRSYADALAVQGESQQWRRELLAHNLRAHYGNDSSKFLVRSMGQQVRGFLSDKFRRLDSRPLLEAFVGACKTVGAVPFEGVASDVRIAVRAIVPQVFEPVPGEVMVFGLSWNNSDFGAGQYGIAGFILRLVCLNGAVGSSVMKQVHLGGRLPDDISLSQKTYELDTRTMASATGDLVRSVLDASAVEQQCAMIRSANEREVDWKAAAKKVRVLTKAEELKARDMFEGDDVLMLPPGKTVWRFSNALSWIANTTTDAERKLELQQAAGAVLAA